MKIATISDTHSLMRPEVEEKALVEEILQIYTTHPGIDVSCDIGPDNKVMMRLLPDYAVFRHDDNQKNGSFPLTRSETS